MDDELMQTRFRQIIRDDNLCTQALVEIIRQYGPLWVLRKMLAWRERVMEKFIGTGLWWSLETEREALVTAIAQFEKANKPEAQWWQRKEKEQ